MTSQSNTLPTKRVAIFVSGNGTNFEALMQASLPMDVVMLVCDHDNVPVIERAAKYHVPVVLSQVKKGVSKIQRETQLLTQLRAAKVEAILLAGYMRIVGTTLLAAYPRRIVNIHPALLPSFPGRTGIEDAFAAGVKVTGVTIHFVDAGVDSGPIIAQEPVRRYDDDQLSDLETRIHEVEHQLYPKTVRNLIEKGVL